LVRQDLATINERMAHSLITSGCRQNRTFTIKTKLSVPDVSKKPSLQSI
jgi:hypothetical protein